MKLSFKTLKNEHFQLEVPADAAIPAVKAAVAAHQNNDASAAGYRLIYAGKVLKDSDTLASASVNESGFLVVMPPSKAKASPAAAPAAAAAASAPPAAAAPPAEEKKDASASAPAPAAPAAAAATGAPSSSSDGSLLMGPAYDESVKRICDMGFPEEQVKKAMRAAFNNPDRAVEYLFSGIPESPEPPAQPAATGGGSPASPDAAAAAAMASLGAGAGAGAGAAAAARAAPGAGAGAGADGQTAAAQQGTPGVAPGTPFDMFAPAPSGGGGTTTGGATGQGAPGTLDFLRNVPQFNMMRRMIQANPALLAQLLAQLDQANPALLSVINANQAEFVRLINEPVPAGMEGGDEEVAQLAAAMAGAGPGEGGRGPGAAPPGQIYVTEEENQQLQRLTELGETMGLERVHVVEAWLACDRDENLAANYLFDHMEEIKTAQEEDAAADAADAQGDGESGNPSPGNPPA